MTYRRRQGKRYQRRRKVTREELVRFHQRAEAIKAEKNARRLARAIQRLIWAGAIAAVVIVLVVRFA